MAITSKDLLPPPVDPTDKATLAYNSVVARVDQLKARFNSNTARLPDVVYMSKDYWDLVKNKILTEEASRKKVRDEKEGTGELQDGATLVHRFQNLIVIIVDSEFQYLQVGILFDSKLITPIKTNIVPTRLR